MLLTFLGVRFLLTQRDWSILDLNWVLVRREHRLLWLWIVPWLLVYHPIILRLLLRTSHWSPIPCHSCFSLNHYIARAALNFDSAISGPTLRSHWRVGLRCVWIRKFWLENRADSAISSDRRRCRYKLGTLVKKALISCKLAEHQVLVSVPFEALDQ